MFLTALIVGPVCSQKQDIQNGREINQERATKQLATKSL
jgi:hypothetical protein